MNVISVRVFVEYVCCAENDFLSTAGSRGRRRRRVMHVDVDPGGSVAAYTRLSQNSSSNTRATPPFLVTPFRVALSYHLSKRTGIIQYRKHRDKPTTCAPVDCEGGGMYTSVKWTFKKISTTHLDNRGC